MKGSPSGEASGEEEMRVRAKIIGVSPSMPGFERQKETSVEFAGDSLMDLLHHISSGMDSETRNLFLDGLGGIPADLAVNVNGIALADSNRGNLRLEEGDLVEMVSSPGR